MLTKQVPALEGPFRGRPRRALLILGSNPLLSPRFPPNTFQACTARPMLHPSSGKIGQKKSTSKLPQWPTGRSRLRLRRGTGRRGPRVHGSPSGGGLGRPPGPLPPPLRPHDRTPGDDARRRGRPADPRPAGRTQRRWGTRRRKAWPSEIAVPSSETTRRPNIRRPRDLPFFPLEGGRLQSVPPAVGLRMVRGPTSVKRLRL